MFRVEDLLLESGLFWCVFDASEHPRAGRMVRAYAGPGGEQSARGLAASLNGENEEVTDGK